jgi:hypothetical protein
MCTITPVSEVNLEVDSWTTTPKATTAGSSLGFDDNVCEDTLSSQSTYKMNSGYPSYKDFIALNPKLLNDFKPSKDKLENIYGGIMKEVNELRLQIASKKTLSAIDHQGITINANIAKVQAQNVVFWPLDDMLGTSLRGTYIMYPYCKSHETRALSSQECLMYIYDTSLLQGHIWNFHV